MLRRILLLILFKTVMSYVPFAKPNLKMRIMFRATPPAFAEINIIDICAWRSRYNDELYHLYGEVDLVTAIKKTRLTL